MRGATPGWSADVRWALWIIGTIATIIVAISVIGLALPRDHVATRSASLKAPPDSVWGALIETKSYPAWRSDVATVTELPRAKEKRSWKESSKNNSITYVAEAEQRPSRLVSRITNDDLPFGGTWTYALVPEGLGTRITITERGWVSNPMFRFVSRFVLGQTATMDTFLRALGKRFGEEVTPA